MNHIMKEKWYEMDGLHRMRDGLLSKLSNEDLAFSPGGSNYALSQLFMELAEIERSYTFSIVNLHEETSNENSKRKPESSIAGIKTVFKKLDSNFKKSLSNLLDEQLQVIIVRANGHSVSLEQLIEVYTQAVFIILGKLVVYFNSLNKELPPSVEKYIA